MMNFGRQLCLLSIALVVAIGCKEKSTVGLSPDPKGKFQTPAATAPGEQLPNIEKPIVPEKQKPRISERELAERILALGGELSIIAAGKKQSLKPGDTLPPGQFFVLECKAIRDQLGSSDIAEIGVFSRLQKLYVGYPSLNDDDVERLSKLPMLTDLSLHRDYGKPLDELTNASMSALGKHSKVKMLYLENALNVDGAGFESLGRNRGLRSIVFSNMVHLTADDLRALTSSNKLSHVGLQRMGATPLEAPVISALGNVPSLQFRACGFTDSALETMSTMHSLESLQLHYCYDFTKEQEDKLRERLSAVKIQVARLQKDQ